jgi:hypothetical protein
MTLISRLIWFAILTSPTTYATEISRRGFLISVSATAAALALPQQISIPEEPIVISEADLKAFKASLRRHLRMVEDTGRKYALQQYTDPDSLRAAMAQLVSAKPCEPLARLTPENCVKLTFRAIDDLGTMIDRIDSKEMACDRTLRLQEPSTIVVEITDEKS